MEEKVGDLLVWLQSFSEAMNEDGLDGWIG